jgi:hypothetical protein
VQELQDALLAREEQDLAEDMPNLEAQAADRVAHQRVAIFRLQYLPNVSATFTRASRDSTADVSWTAVSIPQFVNSSDGVKVLRERPIDFSLRAAAARGETFAATATSRAPPFSASEHARLMHVLIDPRMTTARQMLTRPRNMDELDREPISPWDHHILPLFNYPTFVPEPISDLCHGIQLCDLEGIDPSRLENMRTSTTLADKRGKLKSSYTKVVDNFERCG